VLDAWHRVRIDTGKSAVLETPRIAKTQGGFANFNYKTYQTTLDRECMEKIPFKDLDLYLENVLEHEATHGLIYHRDAVHMLTDVNWCRTILQQFFPRIPEAAVVLAANLFADSIVDIFRSRRYSDRIKRAFPVMWEQVRQGHLLEIENIKKEEIARDTTIASKEDLDKAAMLTQIHWDLTAKNIYTTGSVQRDLLVSNSRIDWIVNSLHNTFQNSNIEDPKQRRQILTHYLRLIGPYLPRNGDLARRFNPGLSGKLDFGDLSDIDLPEDLIHLPIDIYQRLVKAIQQDSNFGNRDRETCEETIAWYRAWVRRVQIPQSSTLIAKGSQNIRASWEWGDSLHALDIIKTLEAQMILWFEGGIGRKKISKQGPLAGKGYYNLFLVIDSSGSMEGHQMHSRTFHSVISAFSLIEFAKRNGLKVAALNFSDGIVDMADWGSSYRAVERVIVQYAHSETRLPIERIMRVGMNAPPCVTVIISDMEITNQDELDRLKDLNKAPNRLVFLDVNTSGDSAVEMKELSPYYYHVKKIQDLDNLVIGNGRTWMES
jgi:hypothetical protein